ncbi:hypothetical protein GF380_00290 [Candidatus Uhrbacteria bacterium]|nr:hypothetical protein [Candidatus Uhrbacteria bacterium]MBD3283856.1 hypothetical protein [Candidatus Uhrbacteria bacterium]
MREGQEGSPIHPPSSILLIPLTDPPSRDNVGHSVMTAHHQYGRMIEAMRKAQRILMVSHRKPDGDTIGATTAVAHWCANQGKDITLFCADVPPHLFHYLDQIHRYTNDPCVFDRAYDLVIVFDSGDLKYAGVDAYIPRIPGSYLLANIDHHKTNQFYGHMNIVEFISSTSEVIYRMFKASSIPMDHAIATSLLTGICWDTSNFSNPLTSVDAMEAASELTQLGARFNDILSNLWYNKSTDVLKLWGLILSRLHYNPRYDVASSYFLKEELEQTSSELTEVIVNFLSAVVGEADTILLLKEMPNNVVRGSFRGNERDVSKIAKFLGGGGHKGASGFQVDGRLEITNDGHPRIVQDDRTIEPGFVTES